MSAKADKSSEGAAASEVLALARGLARQLQPRVAALKPVTLDSHLDRDLGLDSLSRLELIARLEKQFSISLPEAVFSEAETPRDLLRAILGTESSVAVDLEQLEPSAPEAGDATPEYAQTLTEVFDWHARRHPDRAHIRLYREHGEDQILTYGELHAAALLVAANLQARGLQTGQSVALMLPTGIDYFRCFFGVLYAGGIPVPIYPPARMTQLDDHMRRQASILDNAQCVFLITVPKARLLARVLSAQLENLRDVLIAEELDTAYSFSQPLFNSSDTAFLQYTSGSTGNPKGVILSHANLLANIRVAGEAIDASTRDVFVSWLPLYHDMGLIGAWLGSLYFGARLVIMSPLTFLARPARWLQAIHRHGGTLSAAPNFAYQLCLARIEDRELQGLDLSRWRIAMNGAEAVSPDTIEAFSERFARYGFAADAMFPVYGLAENSVGLAFPELRRPPRIDRIRREPFSNQGLAIAADAEEPSALRFVGCGRALAGHDIRIVDTDGHELPQRQQGQLQFRGPSATRGYFHNPEATSELFNGDWLQSGDLAYLAEGELFITGRTKDVIIRGGRNIYPQELEEAVGALDGIRKGRVAVFASRDPSHQTEQLVVLAETRERDEHKRQALMHEINSIATELTQAPADDIVLAPPGAVLKTSSGKIRRAACRKLYEQGLIGKTQTDAWLQLTRMTLHAVPMAVRRMSLRFRRWLYAVYAQAVFRGLAAVLALGTLSIPGLSRRWRFLRANARLFAWLTATRLRVQGQGVLPSTQQPCIYVANHASYIDSYAVVAALPRRFRFVAKAELQEQWLSRTFLQRLNSLFVRRQDRVEGIAGLHSSIQAATHGDSLFYYPEGTFIQAPGLRVFHMGAFLTAVKSGLPIVPVALRGTRTILPGSTWFAHRGEIDVIVCEPLCPQTLRRQGDVDWDLAVRMKELARTRILQHCGEPDMEHERVLPPLNQP